MFTYAVPLSLALLASPAYATIWDIAVGANNLTFTPPFVNAIPGDMINFVFHAKNHSATQSSFAEPCRPLLNSFGIPSGFDSGFHFVAADENALPNYQVKVNDTSPIWVYCMQTTGPPPALTHCQQGMVFAVNPPTTGSNTLAAFQALAKKSTAQNQATWSVSVPNAVATATSAPSTGSSGYDTGKDTSPSSVSMAASSWYTSIPGYTPSMTNGFPTIHPVVVGGTFPNGTSKLQFDPPYLSNIPVGDIILFDFQVANHSATVSSFDEPCARNITDFDSGFQPVTNKTDFLRLVAFTVAETTPTWLYCRQPGTGPKTHCQQGMVFAVNPTPEKTFSQFLMNALKSTVQNMAAAPAPASGSSSSNSYPSTAGSKAISDLSTVSDPSTDSSQLQRLVNYAPAILGLLGGLLVLVLGLLGLLISLVRKSGRQERTVGPSYKPISLAGKVDHEESQSLEYQTPSGRYTDEQ